ncbi:type II toxin-antitoxin system HipA family toxin [Corynebacterium sp. 13CS0277]|uniref:type II toxin-antitoxin system HipA family toxin n=1 Tax=Corynebacterium sp. 13CS0277 TaxID=2071994 RepID=UPI0013048694|nr:HipA domain-containing protein [Corynebacterium sp. 13CS0277]
MTHTTQPDHDAQALADARRRAAAPAAQVLQRGMPVGRVLRGDTHLEYHPFGDAGRGDTTPGGRIPLALEALTGLLPEGPRREVLAAALGCAVDDDLALLLGAGADLLGDLRVVPWGAANEAPGADNDASGAGSPVALRIGAHADFTDVGRAYDPQAIPGVQRKCSAVLAGNDDQAAVEEHPVDTGVPGILKVGDPDLPGLVANEARHLAVARTELHIPVADCIVLHDVAGTPGLYLPRFDRQHLDGTVVALPHYDGAAVLGIDSADKYEVPTETLISALSEVCVDPGEAAANLFTQVAYSWLCGGGDLHAKNVGCYAPPGAPGFQVAPLYDVVCTAIYGDMTMALSIGGRRKNIRQRHLLSLAQQVGLEQSQAWVLLRRALAAARMIDLRATVRPCGVSESAIYGAERELRSRWYEVA